MARKETDYTIVSDDPKNRDKGKTFHLKEMGAIPGEKWAYRAILAIVGSGKIAMPKNAASSSMASLAEMGVGLLSGANWEAVEPLLDEMMQCVTFKEASGNRTLVEEDIEEITTVIALRKEVLKLHLGFSWAEKFRIWESRLSQAGDTSTTST